MGATGSGGPRHAAGIKVIGAAATGLIAAGLIGGQAVGATAAASASAASAAASAVTDWPAYLGSPVHQSYSPAETTITPLTVPDLVRAWHTNLGGAVLASPTVAQTAVFAGTSTGWFYKIDGRTGRVAHKVFIGHQPKKSCGAQGVVSTATVAINPATHQSTVYVAGADGYLYALRTSNLSQEWRAVVAIPSSKVSDYYNWASPTVADGKVYMGVSSNCDHPLVRGGVIAYNQVTGKKLAEFYTVPKGRVGGSVWSSVAVGTDGDVYASTGNGPKNDPRLSYSESILKLAPGTLKLLGRFQVPAAQVTYDGDFGSSPVLFGNLVGSCNKDGLYYALHQSSMKVAWEVQLGAQSGIGMGECLSSPAYNGTDLFFGTNTAAVDVSGTVTTYPGTIQERDPATGAALWAAGLPGEVIGSPALDGRGVVTVPVYGSAAGDGVYLVNAATGEILRNIVAGSDFGQAVFAYERLFTSTGDVVSSWTVQPPA